MSAELDLPAFRAVVPVQVEWFADRLRRTIAEDMEIAADLDAIRGGRFQSLPEPENGGF